MVRGVRGGVVVVHVSSRFPGRASDGRRVARWIVAKRFTGRASPSRSAQPFAGRQPRAPPLGDEFDGWGKLGAHHVGFLPAIGLRPRRNRRRKIPPERGVASPQAASARVEATARAERTRVRFIVEPFRVIWGQWREVVDQWTAVDAGVGVVCSSFDSVGAR